jgi:hypothetical protein
MINWIKRKYKQWKADKEYKRKLEILKKRDPFRYKNF